MFINQYLITDSSHSLSLPNDFKLKALDSNLNLYYHTSLTVDCLKKGENEVYILGYIVDPDSPDSNNSDILFPSIRSFNSIK